MTRAKQERIYPLTFIPALKDYIWGGRNLEKLYGRRLPAGIIAESWEISGHPNGPSHVEFGPLQGKSLPELVHLMGRDLVGTRPRWALERRKFPLLVKLLDAERDLSVQVHPNDDYATRHENGELGKTEMWYVLQARPGARIIFGLKSGVTPASFRQAIKTNTLNEQLHYLPVRPGDAIFVEAGSIHALLAGTMVAEIQQNSDTTYRVYDWGRVGVDGNPRPLHIEKALDVIDFARVEPGAYRPLPLGVTGGVARAEISRCPYFVVERLVFEAGATYRGHTNGSTFEIWGTVQGCSRLRWAGEPVVLPAIRWALLPAALGDFRVEAEQASTMLRVYVP
ncbi:MAG: mannose-6-phosphate isomerase, class I [Anaerolineae bacterium]